MSEEPLSGGYRLVKDKILEQWWIMCDDMIVIPHAINDRDEARSLALHFGKCDVLRDANTKAGEQ